MLFQYIPMNYWLLFCLIYSILKIEQFFNKYLCCIEKCHNDKENRYEKDRQLLMKNRKTNKKEMEIRREKQKKENIEKESSRIILRNEREERIRNEREERIRIREERTRNRTRTNDIIDGQ